MSQKGTSFTLKAQPDLSHSSGRVTGYRMEMEATREEYSMPERQRSTTPMTRITQERQRPERAEAALSVVIGHDGASM